MSESNHLHHTLIKDLLNQPASEDIIAMANMLTARPGVAAILFYGNRLRNKEAEGLLDFYVLTDGDYSYHGIRPSAFFNKVLPPNVYYEEIETNDGRLAAKVAVISLTGFRKRMRPMAWDTTLWARFAQPVVLVYARDESVHNAICDAVITAYETAAWWASRFSLSGSSAQEAWQALFSRTYGAELRVESQERAKTIVEKAPHLYDALNSTLIVPHSPSKKERRLAQKAWARRRAAGKILNVIRLIKAAVTFKGGIAYAISKVERHSGKPVILSPWQKRFPRAAVPFVFIRLLLERRLR